MRRSGLRSKLSDEPLWVRPASAPTGAGWPSRSGQPSCGCSTRGAGPRCGQVELDQLPRDIAFRPDGKVLAVPETWGPGEGYVDILSVPSLEARGADPDALRALEPLLP